MAGSGRRMARLGWRGRLERETMDWRYSGGAIREFQGQRTLRTLPKAGVDKRLWEISDIMKIVEGWEVA